MSRAKTKSTPTDSRPTRAFKGGAFSYGEYKFKPQAEIDARIASAKEYWGMDFNNWLKGWNEAKFTNKGTAQ